MDTRLFSHGEWLPLTFSTHSQSQYFSCSMTHALCWVGLVTCLLYNLPGMCLGGTGKSGKKPPTRKWRWLKQSKNIKKVINSRAKKNQSPQTRCRHRMINLQDTITSLQIHNVAIHTAHSVWCFGRLLKIEPYILDQVTRSVLKWPKLIYSSSYCCIQ